MTKKTIVGLIGDFSAEVVAHRAIESCFKVAAETGDSSIEGVWMGTKDIVLGDAGQFEKLHGVWCVPASPYQSLEGALWAIGYAGTRFNGMAQSMPNSIPTLRSRC